MKLRSFARRPSAAIVISSAALFMSLGGVGYAAVSIPANSVGNSQLKNNAVNYKKIAPGSVGNVRLDDNGVSNAKLANNSVSYKKIKPGSVGTVRADLDQLQARLKSTCPAGSAIGGADSKGKVTCNSVLPAEYGTASNNANLSGNATAVSSVSLPAGPSYLGFANPAVTVTAPATGAGAPRVNVSCTLTVGTATVTRTSTIPGPAAGDTASTSIPLQVAGPAGTSAVTCSASVPSGNALPTTTATAAVNAVAVSSIN